MGVGRRSEGVKTIFNGFGQGGEICGAVGKPLKTVSFALPLRDTPMNGGVNGTALKIIMGNTVLSHVTGPNDFPEREQVLWRNCLHGRVADCCSPAYDYCLAV